MREKVILITGANGEIGKGLIHSLSGKKQELVALDLEPIDNDISDLLYDKLNGNILDKNLLEQISSTYHIEEIYHLAALLSTRAEFSPNMAHEINVTGTLNILTLAVEQAKSHGQTVKFFFPSSIAVYGFKDKNQKIVAGAINESEYCNPITMYGCNKLYCEKLGLYYGNHYHQLSQDFQDNLIDFRSIRFPGIISAITEPQGGTSDYIPQMLHAAARNETYNCFVRDKTRMPFMIMPDAINAIIKLMNAPHNNITSHIYHISTFNPTAHEFYNKLKKYFPNFNMMYQINAKRQQMVDSWPLELNCSKSYEEWGWEPNYTIDKALSEYLIPEIKKHYNNKG